MLAAALLTAVPAAAQLPAPEPPGPYAIDVRVTTSGFPGDAAFFPAAPAGTVVPSRGFGFDVGGHVYLFRLGPSRIGLGASLIRASHTTTPSDPPPPAPGTPPAPRTLPDVEATFSTLAPQVSFNFGSADGWSYLSAGLGIAQVRTETSGIATAASVDSGTLSSINIGGGARWFRSRHLAITFDVRFHVLAAKAQPFPLASTPRSTLLSASGGISLR
jgi:hypothetical protein